MKKTTQEHDPQAAGKLREIIAAISVGMVTTATPDGVFRSRPMITEDVTEDGELWFFTSDDSGKAQDIAAEHGVNVCYADPKSDRYVSVSGNGTLVHDAEKLHDKWDPALTRFFPQGLDDPHLALLCVRIEYAEFWDKTLGRMRPVHHRTSEADVAQADVTNARGEHTRVDIRATPSSG